MLVITALFMLPQFGTDAPKRLPPLPAAKVAAPQQPPQRAPHTRATTGPRIAKVKPPAAKPHEAALPPLAPLPSTEKAREPSGPTEPVHQEGEASEHTAPPTGEEAKPDYDPSNDAQAEIRDAHASPATRYGKLTQAQCMHEARGRNLPIERVGDARGVLAPVRLRGALHGVTYRSAMREAERKTSVFEIFDCRLVLALDDLAHTLAKHDIVEVIHMSAYRPPSAKYWKDGQLGTRHSGALALDAGTFVKKDGTKLNVERDFHGAIGQKACPAPQGNELRALACEIIDQNLFHVFLTPGFNWAHRNHFHIEVSAQGNHFYIR